MYALVVLAVSVACRVALGWIKPFFLGFWWRFAFGRGRVRGEICFYFFFRLCGSFSGFIFRGVSRRGVAVAYKNFLTLVLFPWGFQKKHFSVVRAVLVVLAVSVACRVALG